MVSITTDVLADIDHVEWHGGIRLYGFWCLKIEDDAWVERLNSLTSVIQARLQTGYQRFHHVTIATVGLMNAENWQIVDQQISLLQNRNCEPIDVCWKEISSYVHSPIVSVFSLNSRLLKIRALLHLISTGDDSSLFEPHITLGYYATVGIIDNINMIEEASDLVALKNLKIGNIQFCTYKTNTIKGPISVKHIIDLVAT